MVWNRRNISFLFIGVVVLVLLGGYLFTYGPLAPVKVKVVTAQVGDLQPQIFGIGTVEAKSLYTVGPTQAGRLAKLYVDQGNKVVAGQLLGEMDVVDLDSKINSALAASQRAQSLALAAEMQLQEVQSKSYLAQTKLKRYQELFAENAVSQDLLDGLENDARVTQATVATASLAVQAAEHDVARVTADYQAVVKQRDNLQMLSPVAGVVVTKDMELGNTVVAGQTVFKIANMQSIWVKTRIDQMRVSGIAVGQSADIVLRSMPNKVFKGIVARMDIQSDSVTEERTVYVELQQPGDSLALGDLAEVMIASSPVVDAVYIPIIAVKKINRQSGVWVVIAGKAVFKPVELGVATADGKIQIINGLQATDKVIVASPLELKEGMKVRVDDIS